MISFLRGRVAYVTESTVELDVNGVGYEVVAPTSVLAALPPRGSEVELYTYLQVREDGIGLFGFSDRANLEVFKSLISVSGVGPKCAVGILSVMSTEDLKIAILSGDVKLLSKAPGVGKKTAERIIVELKDRFGRDAETLVIDREIRNTGAFAASDPRQDTILALMELGFSSSEVYRVVKELDPEETDAGKLLKEALKRMGR